MEHQVTSLFARRQYDDRTGFEGSGQHQVSRTDQLNIEGGVLNDRRVAGGLAHRAAVGKGVGFQERHAAVWCASG